MKRSHLVCVVLLGGCLVLPAAVANAQEPATPSPTYPDKSLEELYAYWTPERMANAKPMTMPEVSGPGHPAGDEGLRPEMVPGYSMGWNPKTGLPMPDPTVGYSVEIDAQAQTESYEHGPGPTAWNDYPGYSPYQRWTWFGAYLKYPMSTVGKLFFTPFGGGSAFCSASVISTRTIATAGHCVSDGAGNYHTNWLFCPSYNQRDGVNPARGCWGWSAGYTNGWWFFNGAIDRDFGCVTTAPTGTLYSQTVGSMTGWLGRGWNWGSRQQEFSFGYPANGAFTGNQIIAGASGEWYEVNQYSGDGLVTKHIGGDQHSGNSGGPLIMGLEHRSAGYPPVDASNWTDPGSQTLNGVYSHKRCGPGGCATQLYQNEMGFSQFTSDSGGADTAESEDVFAVCFGFD